MDPFWKTFFEEFKERGRNASLFIFTLLFLTVVLIVTASCGVRSEHVVAALSWLGVFLAARLVWALCRTRRRRREQAPTGPLSCDELRVARSKLTRERNRKGA